MADSSTTTPDQLAHSAALDLSLDTPGPSILHLEHVNFEHPCQTLTTLFYSGLLSLTLDPHRTCSAATLWYNIGQQQFHIQSRGGKMCRTQGAVGLVLNTQQWDEIEARWAEMHDLAQVKGTQMSVERRTMDAASVKARLVREHWNVQPQPEADGTRAQDGVKRVPYYHVVGPWGQLYEVYRTATPATPAQDEASMGMPYVEELLPTGALHGVVDYYAHYFRTPASLTTDTDGSIIATVTAGTRQRLLYRAPADAAVQPVVPSEATWHYAIYLGPFAAVFCRLAVDGLVHSWTEGRSDCVHDWAGAREALQFRGFDLRAPGGEVVWRVEQEIRSGKHRHYNRRLVNALQTWPKQMWAQLQADGIPPAHAV